MSNTYIHKNEAKFKKDKLDEIPFNLQRKWDRDNFDFSTDREEYLYKKDKIAERELKTELKELL